MGYPNAEYATGENSVFKAFLLRRKDKENMFTKTHLQKLDGLQFTNDIIAELDYKVSREGENIDEVTKRWLLEN
jgi:glycine betaine/proline transport system substrate-binding protein